MKALGDAPNKEQYVGNEVDGLHDREDTPQWVNHTQRRGEEGRKYRNTLRSSRYGIDLRDGVVVKLCRLVFEPERHLSVWVRR